MQLKKCKILFLFSTKDIYSRTPLVLAMMSIHRYGPHVKMSYTSNNVLKYGFITHAVQEYIIHKPIMLVYVYVYVYVCTYLCMSLSTYTYNMCVYVYVYVCLGKSIPKLSP